MKKIFCIIFVLICTTYIYAQMQKIVQDQDGQFIEAKFNELGIIEKLNGTISEYLVENLDINFQQDLVNIHTKYSGDGCFNIEIQNNKNYLTLTKIFTANKIFKTRANLTYNIYFNDNDEYFIKDDYITISKSNKKSSVTDASDSYLPMIKYKKNVLIQYFGKNMLSDDIGSRKYEYSNDMRTVSCYEIMPGDVWQKYMTATVFDFKSQEKVVNVINYIILYNYDYQLGVMFFPILFDLDGQKSDFIDIEITADSYLTEGNVKYLPARLKDTAIGTPWCEGLKGDGIGSKITVKAKTDMTTLIISNGFDSLKKYIYYNNNRVKQIRITDLNNKKKFILSELPDSAEPFEIHLPFSSNRLEIEILSVYKGKKYEDTCLNYILAK